ncbi:MAG: aminoacyl-tRNA hydrolase [Simkaniaceae bacterium]|nr:aminoacyl-tRNA hydrolase [Simkaniaceae bacterium]
MNGTRDKWLLIVGLGNPGSSYDNTRHNIGFQIIDDLANELGFTFKKETQFKAQVARGTRDDKKVILLKPLTYMNLSGQAVSAVISFYKIDIADLVVVTDDVELPLGHLRLRASGGSGGHNGLKSIRERLGSAHYPRLRIGVGRESHCDLADYVLKPFKTDEIEQVRESIQVAIEVLKQWIDEGFSSSLNLLTTKLALKNNRS